MSMDDARALIDALKTDHDATYQDVPGRPDVKAHQQAHDATNVALQALPDAVADHVDEAVINATEGLASLDYEAAALVHPSGAHAVRDMPANVFSGTFEVEWWGTLDSYTSTGTQTVVARWSTSGFARSFRFRFGVNGGLELVTSPDGSNTGVAVYTAQLHTFTAGQPVGVKVHRDDGTKELTFSRWGFDAEAWVQIGDKKAGPATIFDGDAAAPLRLALGTPAGAEPAPGRTERVVVRSGSTVVLDNTFGSAGAWTLADGATLVPRSLTLAGKPGTFDIEDAASAEDRAETTRTAAVDEAITYVDRQEVAAAEALLQQQFVRSKGGTIGTDGKGAVAFRFDHWLNGLEANIWPLFKARALPASLALNSRYESRPADNQVSWETINQWAQEGMELWNHSATHNDPSPQGYAGMVDEIVTSKAELEAALPQVKVQGWAMPGVTPVGDPHGYLGFDSTKQSSLDLLAGRLMRRHHPIVETDAVGYLRWLPTGPHHGRGHVTIDTQTLAAMKGVVDRAVDSKAGVRFMVHPGLIGEPGYMSLADFTELLDYVVEKRDAGVLDVLTPSGLYVADPDKSRRAELVVGGDFAGLTTASPGRWVLSGSITIEEDGGVRYARVPSGSTLFRQPFAGVHRPGFGGEAFMASCLVRRPSDATTARIVVEDSTALSRLNRQVTFSVPTVGEWHRFHFPFLIPKDTVNFQVRYGRFGGGDLHVTDCRVYKL